jgi:hypothetical protein
MFKNVVTDSVSVATTWYCFKICSYAYPWPWVVFSHHSGERAGPILPCAGEVADWIQTCCTSRISLRSRHLCSRHLQSEMSFKIKIKICIRSCPFFTIESHFNSYLCFFKTDVKKRFSDKKAKLFLLETFFVAGLGGFFSLQRWTSLARFELWLILKTLL